MTLTEKIFVLKHSYPFDLLRDSELALIADAVKVRRFEPNEILIADGQHAQKLFVVAAGDVVGPSGRSVGAVIGLQSLLFDRPMTETLTASPSEGADCLTIGKSAFFTIVYECPILIVEFLKSTDAADADFSYPG